MKLKAFTLVELLVAIIVSSILITSTASIYSVFKRSMIRDQQKVDLSQNARIILDRLSRELRQANTIQTSFPTNASDQEIAQPHEVEYESGHSIDKDYYRFYLVGTVLKMDSIEYYFSYDPEHRARWNDIGNGGEEPIKRVISTQDIADNVSEFNIYQDGIMTLEVKTSDGQGQDYVLRTKIEPRNI